MKRALLDVEPWLVTLHGRRRRSRIPASITRAERAIDTSEQFNTAATTNVSPRHIAS